MSQNPDEYDVRVSPGFVKHGFILSFYYLMRCAKKDYGVDKYFFYKRMIKEVVTLGGDTDTNACIVGGLIGALVGVKNIDKDMLKTLLNFDCVTCKDGEGR